MPTPEPILIDCPTGYQCQLIVSAVWSVEQTMVALGAFALLILAIVLILAIAMRTKS